VRESVAPGKFAIAASALVVALAVGFALRTRPPAARGPGIGPPPSSSALTPAAPTPQSDSAQGLSCIRGGTSRDEVRRIMGEPDSIAFGDWLYGRSSVTFGYGVVLDYANRDGRLRVCP
jgi:hypothetical protein